MYGALPMIYGRKKAGHPLGKSYSSALPLKSLRKLLRHAPEGFVSLTAITLSSYK